MCDNDLCGLDACEMTGFCQARSQCEHAPEKATTVGIDRDEWYPVYSIEVRRDNKYATTATIPDSLIARAIAVAVEFDEVQRELESHFLTAQALSWSSEQPKSS